MYPRGRQHATKQHVGQHNGANNDDGQFIRQSEYQLDEMTRAHHLCNQVERHHSKRPDRGGHTHRRLTQPKGNDIGERESSKIPEWLSNQEHHDRPADQETNRIDETVKA